jgi:hypothetical protein
VEAAEEPETEHARRTVLLQNAVMTDAEVHAEHARQDQHAVPMELAHNPNAFQNVLENSAGLTDAAVHAAYALKEKAATAAEYAQQAVQLTPALLTVPENNAVQTDATVSAEYACRPSSAMISTNVTIPITARRTATGNSAVRTDAAGRAEHAKKALSAAVMDSARQRDRPVRNRALPLLTVNALKAWFSNMVPAQKTAEITQKPIREMPGMVRRAVR